jgi:hypothetical protein
VGYSGNDSINAAAVCTDIDGCVDVDCGADATCTDALAPATGYTCACDAGFSGGSVNNAAATCVETETIVVVVLVVGAVVICVAGVTAGMLCGWFAKCKLCKKGKDYEAGWNQDVEATTSAILEAQAVDNKDTPYQGNQGP